MPKKRQSQDKVTIQAVAKRAGVSAMTVSNVYNNNGRVSEETRLRVKAAIEELGYVPSQAARRLVGSAPARIGIIYPVSEGEFINAILVAAALVTAKRGLQHLVLSLEGHSPEHTIKGARSLVRSGADALLLFPPFADVVSGLPSFKKLGVPVVSVSSAGPLPNIPTVRIDNFKAAQAVTEHLIAKGRRRIAVLTGPMHHSDSAARLAGYKKALSDNGIPFSQRFCADGGFTFRAGLPAAEKLLSLAKRPNAIVAENDDMAAAAIWTAHRMGLDLPEDLAVTGFDDSLLATRIWPSLTTVRQPIHEMVDVAIDLLISALRHPDRYCRPPDIVLDFKLVERESTRIR